ncbi:MAG: hypothetical protein IKK93_01065 [Campylobacter sp.]|nr:hypothetical protein [Campylobacter sp.]
MIIDDIENFISSLSIKESKYWLGGGKEVHSFDYPNVWSLKKKFEENDHFDLDEKETELILDIIPNDFSHIIHYNGKFFQICYGVFTSVVSNITGKDFKNINPGNKPIFDLTRLDPEDLMIQTRAAYELLKGGLETYRKNCIYDPKNYSIEKVIEKEIDTSKYDLNYTLTKKQTEEMYKWQTEHNKKYHKKGFGYQGASPVSNFEVRFGTCSLGDYADCVCTSCYDKWKEEIDAKKRDKIAKYMQYELFNNM